MLIPVIGIAIAALLALLGARVLRQAARGGALPERLVGAFFLCMGLGGAPALLSNDPRVVPAALAATAMAVGHFALSVGFACLYLFSWRCFGLASRWRRLLALAGPIALALLFVAQGAIEAFAPPGGAVVRTTALVRAVAIAWAFGETLHYHGLMRRRLALGLGDPLVANRFLLWSIWTGAMLGCVVVAVVVRFLIPNWGPTAPLVQRALTASIFLGLAATAGGALSLSFFPPRWYAARLRGAGAL